MFSVTPIAFSGKSIFIDGRWTINYNPLIIPHTCAREPEITVLITIVLKTTAVLAWEVTAPIVSTFYNPPNGSCLDIWLSISTLLSKPPSISENYKDTLILSALTISSGSSNMN